jgi:hypothetical protein
MQNHHSRPPHFKVCRIRLSSSEKCRNEPVLTALSRSFPAAHPQSYAKIKAESGARTHRSIPRRLEIQHITRLLYRRDPAGKVDRREYPQKNAVSAASHFMNMRNCNRQSVSLSNNIRFSVIF